MSVGLGVSVPEVCLDKGFREGREEGASRSDRVPSGEAGLSSSFEGQHRHILERWQIDLNPFADAPHG